MPLNRKGFNYICVFVLVELFERNVFLFLFFIHQPPIFIPLNEQDFKNIRRRVKSVRF